MLDHRLPPIPAEDVRNASLVITGQVGDHPEVLGTMVIPYEMGDTKLPGQTTLKGFVVAAAVDPELFSPDADGNPIGEQLDAEATLAVVMTASGLLLAAIEPVSESHRKAFDLAEDVPALSLFPPADDWHGTLWSKFGRRAYARFQRLLGNTNGSSSSRSPYPHLRAAPSSFLPRDESVNGSGGQPPHRRY